MTQNDGVTIHNIDHIAYKQVPLSDNAFELDSYLAVYDPSSRGAKGFKQRVFITFWLYCLSYGFPQGIINHLEDRVAPLETDVVCVLR